MSFQRLEPGQAAVAKPSAPSLPSPKGSFFDLGLSRRPNVEPDRNALDVAVHGPQQQSSKSNSMEDLSRIHPTGLAVSKLDVKRIDDKGIAQSHVPDDHVVNMAADDRTCPRNRWWGGQQDLRAHAHLQLATDPGWI